MLSCKFGELKYNPYWDIIMMTSHGINLVTPVWGDFMFSVHFRRVRCVRRHNDFWLSRLNRLS